MKYNGIQFKFRFYGIPVVFLHAFPLNYKMWQPQMELVESVSGCYFTYDYPGFGESKEFTEQPTIYDYGKPALQALEEMNIEKAVFVGVSMGGYVALSLYRHHPEIFAGLVLANTRASADTEEGRRARLETIEELRKTGDATQLFDSLITKFFTPETREKQPELVEQVYGIMKESTVTGIIHAMRAMADRPDSMDLLGQMDFPVLVIAGEKDELIPLDEARAMVNALPIGDLSIIRNSAHLSNLEKPHEFNDILHLYLKKLLEAY